MQVKRYIVSALVFAVCAAGAYGQITLGGGIDMDVVPLQTVTRDTAEHEGQLWLGTGSETRTRILVSGQHENRFGFSTDLSLVFDDDGSRWDGRGNLWMVPSDWFRLRVGSFLNDSQTGYVGSHWLSPWTVGMLGPGHIFSAHSSWNIGALARFAPPQVEGLAVYVFVPSFGTPFTRADQEFAWLACGLLAPGGDLGGQDDQAGSQRAFRVFQRTWLTLGYQFAEAFHARLQFIGANPFGTINWATGAGDDVETYRWRMGFNAPRVEAAFAHVTQTLVLDLGVRAWIPISDWITDTWNEDPNNPGFIRGGHPGTFWGGIGFGLGFSFLAMDDLRVNLRVDGDMLRTWIGPYRGVNRITNPMRLSFQIWPQYTLPNGMTLMASVGANYVGRNIVEMVDGTNPNDGVVEWDRSNRLRLGGGLSVAIPLFANSQMSIGLTYRHGTADTHGGEPRVITVPINFVLNW